MSEKRGRGSRYSRADCPTCGEECQAPDTSPDAQRMWAQRHADRTGHTTLVETTATRAYHPHAAHLAAQRPTPAPTEES